MVSTPWGDVDASVGAHGWTRLGARTRGPRKWVHAVRLHRRRVASPRKATGVSRERPPRQKVPRARQLRVRGSRTEGPSRLGRHRRRARVRRCRPQSLFAAEPRLGVSSSVSGTEKTKQTAAPRTTAPTRNARRVAFSFLQSRDRRRGSRATRGFTFSRERAPALSPPTLSCFTVLRAALRTARSP